MFAKINGEIIYRILFVEGVNCNEGNRTVINLLAYFNITEYKHIKSGTPNNNYVF